MLFRVTFFFQQQSAKLGGWSQNFWCTAASVDSCRSAAKDLADKIDSFTGAQVVLTNFRISEVGNFRNVSVFDYTGINNVPVTIQNDADYPTTKLQLQMTGADNYKTTQWIGGLRDSIVSSSGKYAPNGPFIKQWNAFVAELLNASKGWNVYVLDRGRPKLIITNITQLGIVTCPGHGFATGNTIRISGVKGMTQANGLWIITVIDVDNYSLNLWVQPTVAVPAQGKPYARKQIFITKQIVSAKVIRVTSHKVGRPFGQLGGRRRKVRR